MRTYLPTRFSMGVSPDSCVGVTDLVRGICSKARAVELCATKLCEPFCCRCALFAANHRLNESRLLSTVVRQWFIGNTLLRSPSQSELSDRECQSLVRARAKRSCRVPVPCMFVNAPVVVVVVVANPVLALMMMMMMILVVNTPVFSLQTQCFPAKCDQNPQSIALEGGASFCHAPRHARLQSQRGR